MHGVGGPGSCRPDLAKVEAEYAVAGVMIRRDLDRRAAWTYEPATELGEIALPYLLHGGHKFLERHRLPVVPGKVKP